jgi:hypothetical protein
MVTPVNLGQENNAGTNQTVLRAQINNAATLVVLNGPPGPLPTALADGATLVVLNGPLSTQIPAAPGYGLVVVGGPVGVSATADPSSDGFGVESRGGTGVLSVSTGSGNGVLARSPLRNGVQGESSAGDHSGVYGVNTAGGWGVYGHTTGNVSVDRAGVQGYSAGVATGVYGYSNTGIAGYFVSGELLREPFVPLATAVGLRVIGTIVKSNGEYSEALPHPDGSRRLLYAPLCPESWYEDYGRAQLVGGRVEVELDTDFVAVLGIEDGEYHVFLTPEGDTQGLYVESRSAKSFIVREQQAGTTDITFSYRVAAKNKHRSRSQ